MVAEILLDIIVLVEEIFLDMIVIVGKESCLEIVLENDIDPNLIYIITFYHSETFSVTKFFALSLC